MFAFWAAYSLIVDSENGVSVHKEQENAGLSAVLMQHLLKLWKNSKPNIFYCEGGLQGNQVPTVEGNQEHQWRWWDPHFDLKNVITLCFIDQNHIDIV